MAIEPVLLALIAIAPSIIAYMVGRARMPRENAQADVALQRGVLQAFRDANTLHIEDAKTISEQARALTKAHETIAEQAQALAQASAANVGLLAKIDGMPTRIAEQTAQILVKDTYAREQSKALLDAGVRLEDQPVEPTEIPLTPLVPETLLDDLRRQADADGDKTITVTPRTTIEVVENPDDEPDVEVK